MEGLRTGIPLAATLPISLCGCGGMVDASVLGTDAERRGGSSPFIRTILRVGKASGSGSQTVNLIRSRGRIDTSLAHQL